MFAPDELLAAADMSATSTLLVGVQLCGALYFGFAVTNWMAKDNLIGGVYNRPLAIGNALHFFAGAMALLRQLRATPHPLFIAITALYAFFAAAYFLLLFRSPVQSGGDR